MFRQKIQIREKPRESAPPVYSLTDFQKGAKLMINNIVQLKLLNLDITRLELEISNENTEGVGVKSMVDDALNATETSTSGKKMSSVLKPIHVERAKDKTEFLKPERKDLIINAGVRRKFQPLLQLYSNSWPTHSTYACWYCCHTFQTTPVGIPQMMVDDAFYCYGNFCSYNCAMRYLLPNDEDDFAQLQTCTDRFVSDDLSDKIQMLELLCHVETGLAFDECIKMAPKRLTLQLFGGTKSIEEFRNNFKTHTTYHLFRSPMVPISYQMEECSGSSITADNSRNTRKSVINISKLERAYTALLNERKDGAVLQKLLKNKQQSV